MRNSQLQAYLDELKLLLDKSNDNFEKQLNYISSGAIIISLLIVEKVYSSYPDISNTWLIVLALTMFVATILFNLMSHLVTFSVHSKTISEINAEKYNYEKAKTRNNSIKSLNIISLILLILGIVSLVTFSSIAIMSDKKVSNTNFEKKGLPSSPPPSNPTPSTGSPSSPPPQQPTSKPKR